MLKIALVSEFFYPTLGGVQEHLYNVAKQYVAKGHEVKIITPKILTRKKFEEWWPKDLPASIYMPIGNSLPFFMNGSRARICVGTGLRKKLIRLLSPENFDIVHLHAPFNGTLPILAAYLSSTHTIGTFHTSFGEVNFLKKISNIVQVQIDKLEHVIAVSPSAVESMAKYFRMNPEIIPNGIDTNYFKPRSETNTKKLPIFDDGKINILFVGRPDPRNGLDFLIEAFARVYQKYPHTRLIVAGGGGDMEKYKNMTAFLPEGAVFFMGAIRDERADVYRSADIHVFGVEKATFSITVLEGMASGLPVITCPFNGYQALGTVGEHFLTTPFGDANGLANELEQLIQDPQKRERLGVQARAHSLKYDWSIVADRIIGVYDKVLAGRGESPLLAKENPQSQQMKFEQVIV